MDSGTTATMSQAKEIVVATLYNAGALTPLSGPTNGFVKIGEATSGSNLFQGVYYLPLFATGTQNTTATISSVQKVRGTIVTITAIGSGGTTRRTPGGCSCPGGRRRCRSRRESGCRLRRPEAAVYFCCLEAVQNVAKYSGATLAVIRLFGDERYVGFSVEDDGAVPAATRDLIAACGS